MAFNNHDMSWDEAELANVYPLHKAAKDGNFQTVVSLLEANRNLAVAEDRFLGWTPAHWAAYFGKLDCLRNISCALLNVINIQTSRLSLTPSHCAAVAGQAACLRWLLQSGANADMKDSFGETALHKCARSGSDECVGLLIEASCNVRAMNSAGKMASAVAEEMGHFVIATYIHQAELVRELSGQFRQNGTSAFHPLPERMLLSRKRRFEDMNNHIGKRSRIAGPVMEIEGSEMIPSWNRPLITSSSAVEHEKMCYVEQNYTSSLLHCIINDFHGC